MSRPLTAKQMGRGRWKVACINWSAPLSVPHALAYLLVDGEAYGEVYFVSWDDAIAHANASAKRLNQGIRPDECSESASR